MNLILLLQRFIFLVVLLALAHISSIVAKTCFNCAAERCKIDEDSVVETCVRPDDVCVTWKYRKADPRRNINAEDVYRKGCAVLLVVVEGCRPDGKYDRCICKADRCNNKAMFREKTNPTKSRSLVATPQKPTTDSTNDFDGATSQSIQSPETTTLQSFLTELPITTTTLETTLQPTTTTIEPQSTPIELGGVTLTSEDTENSLKSTTEINSMLESETIETSNSLITSTTQVTPMPDTTPLPETNSGSLTTTFTAIPEKNPSPTKSEKKKGKTNKKRKKKQSEEYDTEERLERAKLLEFFAMTTSKYGDDDDY